jgi:hypothetical protein
MKLLLLLIMGQFHPGSTDNSLSIAVEIFVKESSSIININQMFSRETATIIRELGSNRYDTRILMIQLLKEKPDYLRGIFYGSFSKDAEVRGICRYLLEKELPCGHCAAGLDKNDYLIKVCKLKLVYKNCCICDSDLEFTKICQVW